MQVRARSYRERVVQLPQDPIRSPILLPAVIQLLGQAYYRISRVGSDRVIPEENTAEIAF